MLVCPWGGDRLDSVLFAVTARKPGNKDRFELHGIQMAPPLSGSMVIDAAGCATFRALDVLADMLELDSHTLTRHGEIYILDFPS